MWRRSLAAFAGVGIAFAQDRAVDAGPLLCFTTVRGDGAQRVDVLLLAELQVDRPPRELWRGQPCRVLCRLDRDRLLLSCREPYGLVVVDAAAATHFTLADGAPDGFVAVHGDDVLFLGDAREPARDDCLYAAPWRQQGERRRLCDVRLQRVPVVAGNLAIGLGGDGGIHAISLATARARALWQVPAGEADVRVALSPNGQFLAIGTVIGGRGTLRVLETGSGEVKRTWTGLPIDLDVGSSSTPRLEVGFADDDHVVCSETQRQGHASAFAFVSRSIATGEVTDERPDAGSGLSHRAPPPPGAKTPPPPRFEVVRDAARSVLRAVGGDDELAVVTRSSEQYGDLAVSPLDGAFAVARTGEHRRTLLLFAPGDKPQRQLASDWAYDFTWLPASN